jgi:putative nucleotidyltransferase with HDIG domain
MSERIRILFVDDEQNVIDGLVRMFRPQRQVWDVATAGSGAQALEILAQQPAAVVVSDMRMPGMDGHELLRRVQVLHPGTVRIILSGQSDNETAVRRYGPGHYFLSKPCDPVRIAAIISRACELRCQLSDPAIARWADGREDLPSLPETHRRIIAELQAREPSLARLAATIEQDVGLTAELLRIVNSPLLGLDHPVSGIAEAVAQAGIETLRSMVLAVHVFAHSRGAGGLDLPRLWRHSLGTARLARAIVLATTGRNEDAETAFTAGLLHDCGQALLALREPEAYAAALRDRAPAMDAIAMERRAFGLAHDRLGAWLLHRWEIPDPVVEAVAWHHEPARARRDQMTPLAAVHLADALLPDLPDASRTPDAELVQDLHLAERLPDWRRQAEELPS